MTPFQESDLHDAVCELNLASNITMQTVGVRCMRRVNTAIYRKGLLSNPTGEVSLQPPSEDRVSLFTMLPGGKQATIKLFNTGKVRCLKSEFKSHTQAEASAQSIINVMADVPNSGMPRIRLCDAKFNQNNKDFTWSTRQPINMRQLIPALEVSNIRAETDTIFGDSVMVVITPCGSDRQIKGQVLADGTGGDIDVQALKCEVWLTKRNFQVFGEDCVIDMDALLKIMSEENVQSEHPKLRSWIKQRDQGGQHQCVQSVQKVGTVSPRLEVKFMPITIEEWEFVRRKPEPVTISIHHRGEVQLAGNAEYKVLQAFWFVQDLFTRYASTVVRHSPAKGGGKQNRGLKRKLEITRDSSSSMDVGDATPMCSGGKRSSRMNALDSPVALATPQTALKALATPQSTLKHIRADRSFSLSSSDFSSPSPRQNTESQEHQSNYPAATQATRSSAHEHLTSPAAAGQAIPSNRTLPFSCRNLSLSQMFPVSVGISAYHVQQMHMLSVMQQRCAALQAHQSAHVPSTPTTKTSAALPLQHGSNHPLLRTQASKSVIVTSPLSDSMLESTSTASPSLPSASTLLSPLACMPRLLPVPTSASTPTLASVLASSTPSFVSPFTQHKVPPHTKQNLSPASHRGYEEGEIEITPCRHLSLLPHMNKEDMNTGNLFCAGQAESGLLCGGHTQQNSYTMRSFSPDNRESCQHNRDGRLTPLSPHKDVKTVQPSPSKLRNMSITSVLGNVCQDLSKLTAQNNIMQGGKSRHGA